MSTVEYDPELEPSAPTEGVEGPTAAVDSERDSTPERKPLNLSVQIEEVGPCRKHIKIAVAREDVDAEFKTALKDLRRETPVKGFRLGRAPSAVIERRYRKEVAGQVKSKLLMASLEQVEKDYKINAISEPKLDLDDIEIPKDGPMVFEIEVEVEPEFTLPDYSKLTVNRPVKTITEKDIADQRRAFLEKYAQPVPKLQGAVEVGDIVIADLTFELDGVVVNQVKEVQFRLFSEIRLSDGRIRDLDRVLAGAKIGETRTARAEIGSGSPDPAIRGKTLNVHIHIQDLKQLRMPEVTPEFLDSIGFDSPEELTNALRGVVERRYQYQQRQALRRGILDQLHAKVDFHLPTELVSRQEKSMLRRLVMELREAGLSDVDIRAREAEIRANAHEITLRSLKDFFLLSRIAESEGVKVETQDLDDEIEAIAARTDDSPRRVRSRLVKDGQLEQLATQILERKTIDRILEKVTLVDVPMVDDHPPVETIDQTASSIAADDDAANASTD